MKFYLNATVSFAIVTGIRHTSLKMQLNFLKFSLRFIKLETGNSYMQRKLALFALCPKNNMKYRIFCKNESLYWRGIIRRAVKIEFKKICNEDSKRKNTSCYVFGRYRLGLFYCYNGIWKQKVEVSGNRGVQEIGQHTVHEIFTTPYFHKIHDLKNCKI